jgi:RNA polymerase sigma-70 factor (ECF subfamily)
LPLSATDLQRDVDLTALMSKVAEGDQSAFTALYEATSKIVFGLVLRIVIDRATAEEVLLDVFTQAWRQAATFDRKRGTPLAWLMTIARSRAIDRLRSGRHDQSKSALEDAAELTALTPTPEDSTVMSERQQLVRTAIDSLTPEQKEVIELAYFSGLSHTEIASKLGHPLGTVKTRTRLAMMKMREMLSPILSSY